MHKKLYLNGHSFAPWSMTTSSSLPLTILSLSILAKLYIFISSLLLISSSIGDFSMNSKSRLMLPCTNSIFATTSFFRFCITS